LFTQLNRTAYNVDRYHWSLRSQSRDEDKPVMWWDQLDDSSLHWCLRMVIIVIMLKKRMSLKQMC